MAANIISLKKAAMQIRRDVVGMCHKAKASHVASGLSCVDLLAALYLGGILNVDPKKPDMQDRDIFILSKGHASAALYVTLAGAGFFDRARLAEYYQNGSSFPGHPSRKCVPGVEVSTGSLGHGLGLGCGMAYAARTDGKRSRAFVLMSDGELNEGSVWEAALFAGCKKMSNIIAIVDYNKIQSFGAVDEVLPLEPIEKKFESFGWESMRINGNSMEEILAAFSSKAMKSEKPKVIVADTIKGKGVSFMEKKLEWHYKNPSDADYEKAMGELV